MEKEVNLTEDESFRERLLLLVFSIFFCFSFSIRPNSSRTQAGILRRFAVALAALGVLIGVFNAGVGRTGGGGSPENKDEVDCPMTTFLSTRTR